MGELVGIKVEVPGDFDVELSAPSVPLGDVADLRQNRGGQRDPGFAVEEPGDPLRERPLVGDPLGSDGLAVDLLDSAVPAKSRRCL